MNEGPRLLLWSPPPPPPREWRDPPLLLFPRRARKVLCPQSAILFPLPPLPGVLEAPAAPLAPVLVAAVVVLLNENEANDDAFEELLEPLPLPLPASLANVLFEVPLLLLWLCCKCKCGGGWWWLPNGRMGLLDELRPTLLLLRLLQPRDGDGGGMGAPNDDDDDDDENVEGAADASKDWLVVGRVSDANDDSDEVRVHSIRVRPVAPGDSGPPSPADPSGAPVAAAATPVAAPVGGGIDKGCTDCRCGCCGSCALRSSSLSKSNKFSWEAERTCIAGEATIDLLLLLPLLLLALALLSVSGPLPTDFVPLSAALVSSRYARASAPSVMGCNIGNALTPRSSSSSSPSSAPAAAASPSCSSLSSWPTSSIFSWGLSGRSASPSRLELSGEFPLWWPPLLLLPWLLLARLKLLLSKVSSPDKVWLKMVGKGRFAPPPPPSLPNGDLRAPPPPPLPKS